jgi:hypothetical protein
MGLILAIAIVVVVLAIVLGAWGITTENRGEEVLERDELEISRGRQPGDGV